MCYSVITQKIAYGFAIIKDRVKINRIERIDIQHILSSKSSQETKHNVEQHKYSKKGNRK